MTTLERLAVHDVVKTLVTFRDALMAHKDAINALNTLMEKRGLNEEQAMHAIAAKVTGAYELTAV